MKINYKKSLKFVTLLAMSLLIASVSATVYYSLTMQTTVTVGSTWVKFQSADDTPSGSTVQDSYCAIALSALPNSTLVYEKAMGVKNTDTENSKYIRLRHVSITTDNTSVISNFTYIKFYLINSSGDVKFSLNYTTSGDSWNVAASSGWVEIPADTTWYIKVETRAAVDATANIDCTIVMALDVQQ